MERIACIILTFTIAGTLPLDHTPPAPVDHLPTDHHLIDQHLTGHIPVGPHPIDHTPPDVHSIDHTPPDLHPIDHSPPDHFPIDHNPLDLFPIDQSPPDHHPTDHTPPHHNLAEHHQNGHQDCRGPECQLIDEVMNNIGVHLDDHLCHVLVEINCNNHILTHDENICGSDGKTYANHCLFVKARCTRMLDHNNYFNHMIISPLVIASHGACVYSSVPPITTTVSASSEMSAITTGSGTATGTTAISLHNVLGSVFCRNRWSINCGQNFAIVCGSDGNTYPNECELLKWQCDNPALKKVSDSTLCTSS